MKKENILGINVLNIDYQSLERELNNDIKKHKQSFIVAINPEKILKARKDKKLKEILNAANYAIPDGIGVIYASKLRKGNIRKRITGIDTMDMLCELSVKNSYKIFLYGSQKEILEKAKKQLEIKYPNIQIVGYVNGYEKDNDIIIKKINNCRPDIVFVALGSPKQEYWIYTHMTKTNAIIFQGVGGSFDVISGKVKRAPKRMQRMGLEWLYRLFKEPKRFFRQLKLIKFALLVLLNKK